jgi:malate synthase
VEDGIIFFIYQKIQKPSEFIVPDRDQVTMTSPFMSAYSKRVIEIVTKEMFMLLEEWQLRFL